MSEAKLEASDWRGTRVIAGRGSLDHLTSAWHKHLSAPTRIAVLAGTGSMRRAGILGPLCDQLSALAPVDTYEGIPSNPTPGAVNEAAAFLRETGADAIVAIGGGSVIDAAKVANATADAGSAAAVLDRPETVARLAGTLVAIPTTAGTGSEVTPFATIWDVDALMKRSLDTPCILPDLTLIDPVLTCSMGDALTKQTAADAFGHALESLWSRRGSVLSRTLAFRALELLREGCPAVRASPQGIEGRARVQEASLLAGMAISLTRTAAAHALSYALTLRHGVPHGFAVAELLPGVLRSNEPLLSEEIRERVAAVFGAVAADVVPAVTAFMKGEGLLHGLKRFGVDSTDLGRLVEAGQVPGRMDNNLVALSTVDIRSILEEALERG